MSQPGGCGSIGGSSSEGADRFEGRADAVDDWLATGAGAVPEAAQQTEDTGRGAAVTGAFVTAGEGPASKGGNTTCAQR